MRVPLELLLAATLLSAGGVAAAAPVTYAIDPGHTDVIAQWNHYGFSNPAAHFGQVSGTIVHDADDVAASSVEVTIPLAGLSTHVPALDRHLRNADYFDAGAFPAATFRSTSVRAAGDGRLTIVGDLTIKGVTRAVTLDATLNKAGPHPRTQSPTIGFDATGTVLRSDFGLARGVPSTSDEVRLRITTEASAATD